MVLDQKCQVSGMSPKVLLMCLALEYEVPNQHLIREKADGEGPVRPLKIRWNPRNGYVQMHISISRVPSNFKRPNWALSIRLFPDQMLIGNFVFQSQTHQ